MAAISVNRRSCAHGSADSGGQLIWILQDFDDPLQKLGRWLTVGVDHCRRSLRSAMRTGLGDGHDLLALYQDVRIERLIGSDDRAIDDDGPHLTSLGSERRGGDGEYHDEFLVGR